MKTETQGADSGYASGPALEIKALQKNSNGAAKSQRISKEPLLFTLGTKDDRPKASLLHTPTRILGLSLANGNAAFAANAFSIKGRQLLSNIKVPFIDGNELFPSAKGDRTIEWHTDEQRYVHFSEGHYFHDLQLVADYETNEAWTGAIPEFQGQQIPRFIECLFRRDPVRIALLGDSISVGANASDRVGVFPHQAAYGTLWANQLRARCRVEMENFSKNGEMSKWGKAQIKPVSEWNPNLVVIAFGMNDVFDAVPPETVAQNVQKTIEGIAAQRPETEFVIVSGMSPNPEWHLYRPDLRNAYHNALMNLRRSGVAFCGIKPVWDAVVERKGFWSLTGNGVNHPNDFGHRIYASCLAMMLVPEPARSRLPNFSPGNDICIDDEVCGHYFD